MEEGSLYSIHAKGQIAGLFLYQGAGQKGGHQDSAVQVSSVCLQSVSVSPLCWTVTVSPPDPSPKIQTSFPVKNMTRSASAKVKEAELRPGFSHDRQEARKFPSSLILSTSVNMCNIPELRVKIQ